MADGCTRGGKRFRRVQMATNHCTLQNRPPRFVLRVDIGPFGQEELDHWGVAFPGCARERSLVPFVSGVEIGMVCDQQRCQLRSPIEDRHVQRCHPARIGRVDARTMGDEVFGHDFVTAHDRQMQSRKAKCVAGVDVGTLRELLSDLDKIALAGSLVEEIGRRFQRNHPVLPSSP